MNRSSKVAMISTLSLVLIFTFMLSGCSSKPRNKWWQFWRPNKAQEAKFDEASAPTEEMTKGIEGKVAEPGSVAETEFRRNPEEGMIVEELPVIYFDFDQYNLNPSETAKLDKAAEWIKSHAEAEIQVEGHCDERGTEEYNLNLGQKRSSAVRDYIISKGCDSNKLHTISYGEERPVDPGHAEDAWSKNRRAQFLVYITETKQ